MTPRVANVLLLLVFIPLCSDDPHTQALVHPRVVHEMGAVVPLQTLPISTLSANKSMIKNPGVA